MTAWLGGGAVSYNQALVSIPKPPEHHSIGELLHWIASGSDPAAIAAAIASGLGLVASAYQLFGPKPYSAAQGKEDRRHQDSSFKAADGQQATRHGETQASLDALKQQIAQMQAEFAQTAPQQAESFGAAAAELMDSADQADVAIVREIVELGPETAADNLMMEVAMGKRTQAERARQAARLYAPVAPAKAKQAYEEAVTLDETDVWSWIELGRLRVHYDSLAAARACFRNAMQHIRSERDRSVLHTEFGDILVTEGHLEEARSEFLAALAIDQHLAASDPHNAGWQRDLTVSHVKLGDLESSAGDLAEARSRFEAALAIAQRLAESDPHNAEWQRDLTVSHVKLGDLERSAGNLAEARSRFEAALAIAQRLAESDPHNAGWQHDLSVSHEKLGDLAEEQGDIDTALAHYRRSLPIAAELAKRWPDHPQFSSDLQFTMRRIAELEARAT